jgi:hypothetical protein
MIIEECNMYVNSMGNRDSIEIIRYNDKDIRTKYNVNFTYKTKMTYVRNYIGRIIYYDVKLNTANKAELSQLSGCHDILLVYTRQRDMHNMIMIKNNHMIVLSYVHGVVRYYDGNSCYHDIEHRKVDEYHIYDIARIVHKYSIFKRKYIDRLIYRYNMKGQCRYHTVFKLSYIK